MSHSVVYCNAGGREFYPIVGFERRYGKLGVNLAYGDGLIWQTIHQGMRVVPNDMVASLLPFKGKPHWAADNRTRAYWAHKGDNLAEGPLRCPLCGRGRWLTTRGNITRGSCSCRLPRSGQYTIKAKAYRMYQYGEEY